MVLDKRDAVFGRSLLEHEGATGLQVFLSGSVPPSRVCSLHYLPAYRCAIYIKRERASPLGEASWRSADGTEAETVMVSIDTTRNLPAKAWQLWLTGNESFGVYEPKRHERRRGGSADSVGRRRRLLACHLTYLRFRHRRSLRLRRRRGKACLSTDDLDVLTWIGQRGCRGPYRAGVGQAAR